MALEDYYHAASFRPWIREETWYRFEDRLVQSTRRTLDLLERHGARGTFFVGLRTAESAPDLVREIASRGHEIASRGDHDVIQKDLNAERLREDAARCQEYLQGLIGRRVVGYRLSNGWLEIDDLWVLDILADCGYLYDSSVGPMLGAHVADRWLRSRPPWSMAHRGFREVPVSSLSIMGLQVPIAGSGLLRHIPEAYIRRALARLNDTRAEPYVMYFRTWELDSGQPRISAGSVTSRLHYHNLDRMPQLLEKLLRTYRFTSVASQLGIDLTLEQDTRNGMEQAVTPSRYNSQARLNGYLRLNARTRLNGRTTSVEMVHSEAPTPVTIVVPCFNERQSLGYLKNTLQSVVTTWGRQYAFRFVFVDDCSTDGTWSMLQELFGSWADCHFARHEDNRGVAASILTGIRSADTEIVCSIDCDCTYDPHELGRMIPLLTEGVQLVTASPYHPAGGVRNVPGWRLFLSKGLSQLYRVVLHQKLFTYTSCFRVYRRQSTAQLDIRNTDFLGIAELLARGDLAGQRIVEYPTILESRVLGQSKMKVARTVGGHLKLLSELVRLRLSRSRSR